MANNLFSYTNRDYESTRQEGLVQIPRLSNGNWTDLNASDPGIIILDYVHALVDMVNFYQDHQALETFLPTAKERINLFRIVKQLGYQVPSAKGAYVDVTFYSSYTYTYTIKIPKHTRLLSTTNIPYLTAQDGYLVAGDSSITIPCMQGSINTFEYRGTGISRFSKSPPEVAEFAGFSNQNVILTAKNIDTDTIAITDNSNRIWERVPSIVFTDKDSRCFEVELNYDDTVTIKFGDGERGIVPEISDLLTITYITNLAENGKVGVNEILRIDDTIYDDYENIIQFSVSNSSISNGGNSSQSSSDIKRLALGAIKSQNRAVTLSDFESLARLVDGVAEAKAYDINVAPDLCLHHEVKLLVVPNNGVTSNRVLESNVYDYVSQRMIPPTNLQVLTPSPISININLVVKAYDNLIDHALEYDIRKLIVSYFEEKLNSVGEDFIPNELSSIISRLPNVQYVESMTPMTKVSILPLSIAVLGELTITVL